ncbi:LOW QUALITY PROTEIN: coilin, partial [Heterodontus francisci]|uniref:LOW QUALITY PROTEIN: coilin n=1 Tax=Heterodontus francisci TaxID=7792 RepID=UPI00355ACED5
VKQEELITENGFVTSNSPDWPSVKPKKRHRHQSVDNHQPQSENGRKKKRRKGAGLTAGQRHDSTGETVSIVSTESSRKRKNETEGDGKYNVEKKHYKKKKDKSGKDQTGRDCSSKRTRSRGLGKAPSEPSAAIPLSKLGERKNASNDSTFQREVAAQALDSECLSSDPSESDRLRSKNHELETASTIAKIEACGSSANKIPNTRSWKRPTQANTATKMTGAKGNCSSDSLSSDSETPMVKKASTMKPVALSSVERISGQSENGVPNAARSSSEDSSDSQDSESGKLESKPTGADSARPSETGKEGNQPITTTLRPDQTGNGDFGWGNGRGRGRGFCSFPWRDRQQRGTFRGRGRGAGFFSYNYESSQEPRPGESNESVTKKHVIVENPPEIPKRDYSKLPLLAAPPQVGERIAFKMLELSENYTPELSDYKEGRIISYNPSTQQVELAVDTVSTGSSKEPGKFDLIYQTESGEDVVEYAVTRKPQVTESWSSLVEPRLIVASAAEPVAVELPN